MTSIDVDLVLVPASTVLCVGVAAPFLVSGVVLKYIEGSLGTGRIKGRVTAYHARRIARDVDKVALGI